ncbi:MAG: recombination mediator RecR [Planctomycetaceae bacterium]
MPEQKSAIPKLVEECAKLPGIGRKSAERLAYHVLRIPRDEALCLADAIRGVKERLRPCRTCHNLCEDETCDICRDPRRDAATVCVVEQVRDLLSIEDAGGYRGVYHVLQGRLAPLDGIGPDQLTIRSLVERVGRGGFREVILATSPNVEGDATALAVVQSLHGTGVEVTRLARGLTAGSSFEHANRDMLSDALAGRTRF